MLRTFPIIHEEYIITRLKVIIIAKTFLCFCFIAEFFRALQLPGCNRILGLLIIRLIITTGRLGKPSKVFKLRFFGCRGGVGGG